MAVMMNERAGMTNNEGESDNYLVGVTIFPSFRAQTRNLIMITTAVLESRFYWKE